MISEEQIRDCLGHWQVRLGLGQWQIAVRFVEGVEVHGRRAAASAQRTEFYERATICFDRGLLAAQPENTVEGDLISTGAVTAAEFVEVCVVHELLHLAARDMMEAGDLVRDHLAPPAVAVWDGAWKRAEEAFCERTALALVSSFGVMGDA